MSMAAGEYVSVSSQSDTERRISHATRRAERKCRFELEELADIYVKRGLDQPLAWQVAQQLMAKDALTPMRAMNSGFLTSRLRDPSRPR